MDKYQHDILNIIDEHTSNKIKEIIFNEFKIDLSFIEDLIFRKRLTYSLNFQQIKPEDIVERNKNLTNEQIEIILHCVFPDECELFRDTDTWLFFKYNILNTLISENKNKILIYNATAGEDLYSILILLNELKILDNFEITVTSPSNYSINNIKNGIIAQPKSRISFLNFKTIVTNDSISTYLEYNNTKLIFNNKLLNNTNIFKSIPFDKNIEDYDLVLCRNKTLCFNKVNSENLFIEISKHVKSQGYIIIGTNENFSTNLLNTYNTISLSEKIFQKK